MWLNLWIASFTYNRMFALQGPFVPLGETEAGRRETTCQRSDSERQECVGSNSGLALSGYSVQIIKDNRFQKGDQRPASLFTKRNPH